MKIIEPGHIYQLEHQDGSGAGLLVFVNREDGTKHEGTQTQEVLRALIDRTRHCDSCLRWAGNDEIIEHLRTALILHETRALERKAAKGVIVPEAVATADDGHFALSVDAHDRAHAESVATSVSRLIDPAGPFPCELLRSALPPYDGLGRVEERRVPRREPVPEPVTTKVGESYVVPHRGERPLTVSQVHHDLVLFTDGTYLNKKYMRGALRVDAAPTASEDTP